MSRVDGSGAQNGTFHTEQQSPTNNDKNLFDKVLDKKPELDRNQDGKMNLKEMAMGVVTDQLSLSDIAEAMTSKGQGTAKGNNQSKKLDANGDGKTSAKELLEKFDKDEDGKLSKSEVADGMKSLSLNDLGKVLDSLSGSGSDSQNSKPLDADDDGKITSEEITNKFDKNNDGKVSKSEMNEGVKNATLSDVSKAINTLQEQNNSASQKPSEGDSSRLDANNDGNISGREVLNKFDENGDGKLSKDEFSTGMKEKISLSDLSKLLSPANDMTNEKASSNESLTDKMMNMPVGDLLKALESSGGAGGLGDMKVSDFMEALSGGQKGMETLINNMSFGGLLKLMDTLEGDNKNEGNSGLSTLLNALSPGSGGLGDMKVSDLNNILSGGNDSNALLDTMSLDNVLQLQDLFGGNNSDSDSTDLFKDLGNMMGSLGANLLSGLSSMFSGSANESPASSAPASSNESASSNEPTPKTSSESTTANKPSSNDVSQQLSDAVLSGMDANNDKSLDLGEIEKQLG